MSYVPVPPSRQDLAGEPQAPGMSRVEGETPTKASPFSNGFSVAYPYYFSC